MFTSHGRLDVRALVDDVDFRKQSDILEWLHPGPFDSRHVSLREGRVENSGQWFIDSKEFQGWIKGTGPNTLLCIGIRVFPS